MADTFIFLEIILIVMNKLSATEKSTKTAWNCLERHFNLIKNELGIKKNFKNIEKCSDNTLNRILEAHVLCRQSTKLNE